MNKPVFLRDLTPNQWQVPELPKRYILDLRSDCNLKCPMCLLHGTGSNTPDREAAIGKMSVAQAGKILDEIMAIKPMIQPAYWGEPTLAKDFREHIAAMKSRGIAVAMNTNGLLLREDLCRFMVTQKVDAVFVSLDSTTPETLKKIRGIDKLDKIERNLKTLLRVRDEMGAKFPRIGATFSIQPENEHELEAFIDKWIGVVDLVRVGAIYVDGKLNIETEKTRTPCTMIYETMPIHANGDVSMCCFDSHNRSQMGNVFTDGGVKAVWHGDKFTALRKIHETGDYDKAPVCKSCNAWQGRGYEEYLDERAGVKVLIRRSPQFTYFNRVDRLDTWHDGMSGHAKLNRDVLCTSE